MLTKRMYGRTFYFEEDRVGFPSKGQYYVNRSGRITRYLGGELIAPQLLLKEVHWNVR